MRIYKKAILPLGFKANAVACGIKKKGKLDLALFYSDRPALASCQFTSNKIKAAPLKLNKEYLKSAKSFRAIVANSGNANCFTGRAGLTDAQAVSAQAAKSLGVETKGVLAASTGIIGKRLPASKIKTAMPVLANGLSSAGIDKAKKAILTTDTFTKEVTVKFNAAGKTVTICGIAKGAGMIAPDMATMLCFIFTDALISPGALRQALKQAVAGSFNCITVDGCMSTNDSVMMLANGASGNTLIGAQGGSFGIFCAALNKACLELAKAVVRDGEGATKFIAVTVAKAKDYDEARKVALSIANSNLFKTAIYGRNPNFGRIIAAAGASGVGIREENLKLRVSALEKREISVYLELKRGRARATVYTSDLTPEYVKINAEYN